MTILRGFLLCCVLALAAGGYGLWQGVLEVPPRWNPWAPLDLNEPPGLLTRYKLGRLAQDPARCEAVLEASALDYTPMSDATPEPGCALRDTLRVERSRVAFSAPFRATCPLAVAYLLFERHALQPAAQTVFGSPVVRVEHFGSFACRNIARSNRRSQHATANALDLAGFRLADGTRITVARDWDGEGDKARFLRLVRAGACSAFNTTLGPEYNAAHRDHFHVDMGGHGLCR